MHLVGGQVYCVKENQDANVYFTFFFKLCFSPSLTPKVVWPLMATAGGYVSFAHFLLYFYNLLNGNKNTQTKSSTDTLMRYA